MLRYAWLCMARVVRLQSESIVFQMNGDVLLRVEFHTVLDEARMYWQCYSNSSYISSVLYHDLTRLVTYFSSLLGSKILTILPTSSDLISL